MLQGYNLRHWTQSGMIFWAVSDLNSGELAEFVKLIKNPAADEPIDLPGESHSGGRAFLFTPTH